MNLKDLKEWAEQQYVLDNAQLMQRGVKDRFVSKIKPHLKSVIDKASEVLASTERNNRTIGLIEDDVKNLGAWGLAVKEAKKEETTTTETKPEEAVQPVKRENWYTKK